MAPTVSNRVICLLCKLNEESCSLHHIYEHLSYKKYSCLECKFTGFTEDMAVYHQWKTSHSTTVCTNKYIESLCYKIYMDCLRATESESAESTTPIGEMSSTINSSNTDEVYAATSTSDIFLNDESGEECREVGALNQKQYNCLSRGTREHSSLTLSKTRRGERTMTFMEPTNRLKRISAQSDDFSWKSNRKKFSSENKSFQHRDSSSKSFLGDRHYQSSKCMRSQNMHENSRFTHSVTLNEVSSSNMDSRSEHKKEKQSSNSQHIVFNYSPPHSMSCEKVRMTGVPCLKRINNADVENSTVKSLLVTKNWDSEQLEGTNIQPSNHGRPIFADIKHSSDRRSVGIDVQYPNGKKSAEVDGSQIFDGKSNGQISLTFGNIGMESNLSIIRCNKCRLEVGAEYTERRRHVTEKHMSGESDAESFESLSLEIKRCFPHCLIYSDDQCVKCGKIYLSTTGRKEHLTKEHGLGKVFCIFPNCSRFERAPFQLANHIKFDHGVDLKSKKSEELYSKFRIVKAHFFSELSSEMKKHFPIKRNSRSSSICAKKNTSIVDPNNVNQDEPTSSSGATEDSWNKKIKSNFPLEIFKIDC